MADPTQPSSHSSAFPDLPESHLATVIEDAVDELDASSGGEPQPQAGPDLRKALLYGWATGAVTSRDLALRSASDSGLIRLLHGAVLSFEDVRAYREAHQHELEQFYASLFELLALAGFSRLGRIRLTEASDGDGGFAPYLELARELLSEAATADFRDDRELGRSTRVESLPAALASRAARQEAFRAARSGRKATAVPTIAAAPISGPSSPDPSAQTQLVVLSSRPQARVERSRWHTTQRQALGVLATLVVVLAGLIFVRWLSAFGTSPETRPSGAAQSQAAAVPAPQVRGPTVIPTPSTEPEMQEARDEAVRLAGEALDDNDIQAARDYYFLAAQAMPQDEEVKIRLRETETALGIADRRSGWDDAVLDLDDLRAAAPNSNAVLQAYVSALVSAGRLALSQRDVDRAGDLCGEAVRWFPNRDDARSCYLLSGRAPTATPQPTATTELTPTPGTPTPVPTVTPTVLGPATPVNLSVPGVTPTEATSDEPIEALQVSVTGGCQPLGAPEGAATLRISGGVSSASGPVPNYHLVATAASAGAPVLSITNTTYLTPTFQLQQRVVGSGTYVVSVFVEKDGYTAGQSSVRITC